MARAAAIDGRSRPTIRRGSAVTAVIGLSVRLGGGRADAPRPLWAQLNWGRGQDMDAVDLGVNLFGALFALVDPIGNLPIFAAATAGATLRQRISVSALICLFAVVFLGFFFFTGLGLLQFFGISLAAFRIAGGILLLFLGLDMAREDFLKMFADADAVADAGDVRGYAKRRFQRLIVPFAIPLMIGPGAISAVIIQAGEAERIGPAATVASLVAIAAACAVSFVCFSLTGPISRIPR